ncbi:hypothetical protein [Aestuariicoccus sp. MJ-SS9]|uniref:hypothetical protein n=1 Tax=Aestuariicoccus sp. MJ-SS9 TaxID=3079855 RepID=UPI0029076B35|nr:hypothetical protein [Aestuariicoccus sp. MJ-SS9]MDU8913262.1 hypothetical protein [Aestuariicoccus sp. MJ-SS9]
MSATLACRWWSPGHLWIKPDRNGLAIGAVIALSLAVGLETFVFLCVAGAILTWDYIRDRPFSETRLLGVGTGLGALAPVLFVAQTSPAEWGRVACDALSAPYLALTLRALLFSLGAALLLHRLRRWPVRALYTLISVGLLLVAAFPLYSACLSGPLSQADPLARRLVIDTVSENMSAFEMIRDRKGMAIAILVPHLLITVSVLWLWLTSASARRAWGILAVFLLLGTAGTFYQFRAMPWGGAVQMVAFGAILAALLQSRRIRSAILRLGLLVVFVILVMVPQVITALINTSARASTGAKPNLGPAFSVPDRQCLTQNALAQLDGLPPATIMSPLNMGTRILLFTDHSVTSVPYHRSGAAMLNGVLPFAGSPEAALQRFVEYKADYVVICSGTRFADGSFGKILQTGPLPGWLQRVSEIDAPISAFQVVR